MLHCVESSVVSVSHGSDTALPGCLIMHTWLLQTSSIASPGSKDALHTGETRNRWLDDPGGSKIEPDPSQSSATMFSGTNFVWQIAIALNIGSTLLRGLE